MFLEVSVKLGLMNLFFAFFVRSTLMASLDKLAGIVPVSDENNNVTINNVKTTSNNLYEHINFLH